MNCKFSTKMNSVNNILGQKFNYLSIDFEGKDFQEQILNKIALEALKNIDENLDLKENEYFFFE